MNQREKEKLQQDLELEEYNQQTLSLVDELIKGSPQLSLTEKTQKLNTVLFRCKHMDSLNLEAVRAALVSNKVISQKAFNDRMKKYQKNESETTTDDNTVIVHSSYEVKDDFMSLGFKETVVEGETPKDRNIYLIASDKGYAIHDKPTFKLNNRRLVFDQRDRLLINLKDRWNKNRLTDFIENPGQPENLYIEIKKVMQEFIEHQKVAYYGLVTSWTIATYFSQCFYAFPFMFFYGKKRSGKTRMLNFLERLTFNAMKSRPSVAALGDSIDGVRGTYLIDQAESLSDSKNVELLNILTDSYTTGGGTRRIVDMNNKSRRVREFETYGPKAFASTKDIDSDLKDRCILIPMLRARGEYPEPEPYLPIWQVLRDKLYRLLLTRWRDIKDIYQNSGDGVTQRIRELWRPLETILILECVPIEEREAIKKVFLESMLETQEELSDLEGQLFDVLFSMLREETEQVISVKEIADKLEVKEMTEKGLQTWIGRALTQFSLYGRQAGRKGNSRAYRFSLAQVKDVYSRYHQTTGIGGQVVKTQQNQLSESDHIKNEGGNEVVGGYNDTTTYQPPLNNEVVTPEFLINKDKDHLTTKTTTSMIPQLELENLREIEL